MKTANHKINLNFSKKAPICNGFSLPEIIIVATIIGVLTTIALPNYLSSLRFAKQKEAEIVISTLLTSVMSFTDENGRTPKGWDDLNYTQPLKIANGIASGNSYSQVLLPGENYHLKGTISADTIVFEADSSDNWNVVSCINTSNGLSAIKKGPIKENNKPEAKQVIDANTDCPSTT